MYLLYFVIGNANTAALNGNGNGLNNVGANAGNGNGNGNNPTTEVPSADVAGLEAEAPIKAPETPAAPEVVEAPQVVAQAQADPAPVQANPRSRTSPQVNKNVHTSCHSLQDENFHWNLLLCNFSLWTNSVTLNFSKPSSMIAYL